jgi:hypothetical protein
MPTKKTQAQMNAELLTPKGRDAIVAVGQVPVPMDRRVANPLLKLGLLRPKAGGYVITAVRKKTAEAVKALGK